MRNLVLAILFCVIVLSNLPAEAEIRISGDVVYFIPSGWKNTHELIYESTSSLGFGIEAGYKFEFPLEIAIRTAYLNGSGKRVWLSENGEWERGEVIEYTLIPSFLTARWHFFEKKRLAFYSGAGFGFTQFKETDSDQITKPGYLIMGGGNLRISKALLVFLEADWMSFPNSIGDQGASLYFDETDLGGLSFISGVRFTF